MYDPVIGRWGVIDGKAELYFSITPYAYAANTPTNAIDPDGHLVIFVAGMNLGNGKSSSYWSGFDKAVMTHFNDFNRPNQRQYQYYDGALGGAQNTLA